MWRNFFEQFDPIFFSFGSVSVSWYGICFFSGAIISLLFLYRTLQRKDFGGIVLEGEFFDFATAILFGAIVGARLGYVALYHPLFFWEHPSALFSPFDVETGQWIGITGMSAHGGVLGIAAAIFFFSRKYRKPMRPLLDAVAFSVPISIFFGRIGNFLAGELFGRTTDMPWGLVFLRAEDGLFRHPSQLYEALGEGVILFCAVFFLARRRRIPGMLFAWTLGLYGLIRFFLEFFREPDRHIGFFFGVLSEGQILSILMVLAAYGTSWWLNQEKDVILPLQEGKRDH